MTLSGPPLLVVLPASQSADGAQRSTAPQITVVLSWFDELKTRVPIK